MPKSLRVVLVGAALGISVLVLPSASVTPQVNAGPLPQVVAGLTAPPAVPPSPSRAAARVTVSLETRELTGTLADGVQYMFWTFNGTVPGPMIRIRVGDEVELHLKNNPRSSQIHSIDLHAVNGPGGGSTVTQTAPGKESVFRWKALNPGLYVYHCASPHIPTHIANGMYGLIVVEPEGGLPKVDREFYVLQGEFYTKGARGMKGMQAYDSSKAYAEHPEYVVLNGRVGALTDRGVLTARTGQTVRIFAGNGGPNLVWAFHVIGEIFDRVYREASVGGTPETNVQTTLIPPGGAAIVEFKVDVPGTYLLVDHSIFRIDQGAVGQLKVEGAGTPGIFEAVPGGK
ncbi:MAG TPA: copper-containing nitrite reductase [bacterium]